MCEPRDVMPAPNAAYGDARLLGNVYTFQPRVTRGREETRRDAMLSLLPRTAGWSCPLLKAPALASTRPHEFYRQPPHIRFN